MKQTIQLLIITLITSMVCFSCKKEETSNTKTTLLHKRSFVQGTASWGEEIQYDARGKVTGIIATNSELTLNYTATLERNSDGKVSRLTFNNNRGHYIYEHDSRGKLVKTNSYYGSGALASYETYGYFDDRYETSTYNSTGLFTGKSIYYYTADKKNIATKKQYNSSAVQTQEITYTYAEGKNNYLVYVESSPFINGNMIATETTKTFSPANTVTATTSYTYNAEGYAETSNKTSTNGMAPLNGKYEYTTK